MKEFLKNLLIRIFNTAYQEQLQIFYQAQNQNYQQLKYLETQISKSLKSNISVSNKNTEVLLFLFGNLYSKFNIDKSFSAIEEAEFKVFSQFGEDGIIQHFISTLPIDKKIFIEFGVQDYSESNTRFLLMNNNWEGLILDSEASNIEKIKTQPYYWKHQLTAIPEFVTNDNINQIIKENNFSGNIGLLSIDIDGNDYHIWESITEVEPDIVICEYNSLFGKTHPVTIPYDPDFDRTKAHFSNLYFGASLPALIFLAKDKGYAFVGCNSAGNNAFFIKKTHLGIIKELTCEEGFVNSHFRESLDEDRKFTYLSNENRINPIKNLPVVNVITNAKLKVKDLLNNTGQ